MISILAHIIGFIGMGFVVLAFYMVVKNKWRGDGLPFNVVNCIGAVLLLLSLLVHFNLGSFVIELFWIGISVTGIREASAFSIL